MGAVNNGGPAFPDSVAVGPAGDLYGSTGMTLRDYFFASLPDEPDHSDYSDGVKEALVGRICPSLSTDGPLAILEFEAEFRAKWRGMRADAMLAERAK